MFSPIILSKTVASRAVNNKFLGKHFQIVSYPWDSFFKNFLIK